MDDPFFGRLWDRYPQRRSHPSPYSSHPYPAATVTPTKPEHEHWGAPKLKPKTFTVPVQGPPNHSAPHSSLVTKAKNPSKPIPKNVVSIPINSEAPKSSSGIKKSAAPRIDDTTAATKLQSVFRGFSARKSAPLKNLRVIRDTKAEAEAIRRRLADRQVVESILQNEKERLKITEEIMSLLLKLDAIQGVNSFVRDSRKAVVRELLNLQEMVDAIIAGKSIEGRVSMDAGAAEDDNHGDEMAASAEENGEACLERDLDKEEIRDEEVLDGSQLASANDLEVQEEVSVLSHKIENRNMQVESPNHTEDKSMGMGGNGRVESTEVVAPGEPMDLQEKELKDQELEQHVEEVVRDSLDDEKCTDGNSSCEGRTGEELRTLESHSMPSTDEEVTGHSMDEEESPNSASDCEVHICKRLKAFDRSQAEGEIIQADEQQRECEGMECQETGKVDRLQSIQADEQQRQCEGMEWEETGKVIEPGSGAGEIAKVEEDVVKMKDENETLKKTVADLLKKSEFQNELITNMSLRIAQLEEQISKSKRNKTRYRKKKTKETSPSPTERRKTE